MVSITSRKVKPLTSIGVATATQPIISPKQKHDADLRARLELIRSRLRSDDDQKLYKTDAFVIEIITDIMTGNAECSAGENIALLEFLYNAHIYKNLDIIASLLRCLYTADIYVAQSNLKANYYGKGVLESLSEIRFDQDFVKKSKEQQRDELLEKFNKLSPENQVRCQLLVDDINNNFPKKFVADKQMILDKVGSIAGQYDVTETIFNSLMLMLSAGQLAKSIADKEVTKEVGVSTKILQWLDKNNCSQRMVIGASSVAANITNFLMVAQALNIALVLISFIQLAYSIKEYHKEVTSIKKKIGVINEKLKNPSLPTTAIAPWDQGRISSQILKEENCLAAKKQQMAVEGAVKVTILAISIVSIAIPGVAPMMAIIILTLSGAKVAHDQYVKRVKGVDAQKKPNPAYNPPLLSKTGCRLFEAKHHYGGSSELPSTDVTTTAIGAAAA